MKKSILLLHFILLYLPSLMWCQIKILPEIGFSYHPFTFTTATTSNPSHRLDYLVGISAQMPIHENLEFSTRISFADREDIQWQDLCLCPGYLGEEFRHSDLNFDLSILYVKNKYFHFGLGPSAIIKFAQWETWNEIYEDQNRLYFDNRFYLGLNSNVIFVFKRFGINLTYIRVFTNLHGGFSPSGQNRFDMTVSYDLFTKS